MSLKLLHGDHHHHLSTPKSFSSPHTIPNIQITSFLKLNNNGAKPLRIPALPQRTRNRKSCIAVSASLAPLDLSEDNINLVLADARVELGQLFDNSVGITGKVELAELDGPYVKIRLSGKFWHTRSSVLARLGNYLKQRIPEILEVDIEDEKQLDDSPENF